MKNKVIGSRQLRHLVATLNALVNPTGHRHGNNLPAARLEQGDNPHIRIDSIL